jgi:hypothetical protein
MLQCSSRNWACVLLDLYLGSMMMTILAQMIHTVLWSFKKSLNIMSSSLSHFSQFSELYYSYESQFFSGLRVSWSCNAIMGAIMTAHVFTFMSLPLVEFYLLLYSRKPTEKNVYPGKLHFHYKYTFSTIQLSLDISKGGFTCHMAKIINK